MFQTAELVKGGEGTQIGREDYFSPAFGGTHSWIFLRVVE